MVGSVRLENDHRCWRERHVRLSMEAPKKSLDAGTVGLGFPLESFLLALSTDAPLVFGQR